RARAPPPPRGAPSRRARRARRRVRAPRAPRVRGGPPRRGSGCRSATRGLRAGPDTRRCSRTRARARRRPVSGTRCSPRRAVAPLVRHLLYSTATVVADTATSLRRGIVVLQTLQSDEAIAAGGLGVLRVAELVGDDKSQISRTLKALHQCGLVDRDPDTRAYRLGWALFALAARAGDTHLLAAGERTVRELVQALGERVHLTILQGADVLTVLSESPPHTIQAAGWVGRSVPAHCASSGQALLVDHSLEEVVELLADVELVPLGPNAPRTIEEFYGRLEAA